MNQPTRRLLFLLFFISGFCGLLYQVVWTRLAFAAFGVVTPVLSVVLSVFMLGLAVGSWAGGRLVAPWTVRTGLSAAYLYAGAEFIIGLSAFAVPRLFDLGVRLLLSSGQSNSFGYLSLSAVILASAILPWCLFMGTTFPFMMGYVREQDRANAKSFSFLYLANVLGAMAGTFFTAVVLVELLGFRHTLWVAASGNFALALISAGLGRRQGRITPATAAETTPPPAPALPATDLPRSRIKWILFSTGFCAMAMEVVWTRAFTPVLQTQVYSYALIVFIYLGATFAGSLWYRRHLRAGTRVATTKLLALLAVTAFIPILTNDMRLVSWSGHLGLLSHDLDAALPLLAGICPLCLVLGYLTPRLVDEYAAGNPKDAGQAYALNVLGCILGPLVASYLLLPWLRERHALILLGLPLVGFWLPALPGMDRRWRLASGLVTGLTLLWASGVTLDYEEYLVRTKQAEVRLDYAASVISCGQERYEKTLLVNGIGMTILTPITKFMVHLPLVLQPEKPRSALIICFGMGTTYRSALSWDIDVTAVELVPSVPRAFEYYHADAAQVRQNPRGRIIIDDGRRFLSRTRQKFDVIVIDPPPPIEAAGSSLLYSTEFFELARQHLNPHGILQTWVPGGVEIGDIQAVLRSLEHSFPHVRCFDSISNWGVHLLASNDPIEIPALPDLVARMPAKARNDLLEWAPSRYGAVNDYLGQVLSQETPLQQVLNPNPELRITDDRPFNEYFLLRHAGLSWR